MDIKIPSYEEFINANGRKKYDGSTKCFVHWCDKPAYYEGGDARFYCGMCAEHAGLLDSYIVELKYIARRIRARMLWDKSDETLPSLLEQVTKTLQEFIEKKEKRRYEN